MRRILIDTDTASDDAVALIFALRDDRAHVEAITVVAGNVPVDLGVKNALTSVQMAATYTPPVYRGSSKPMMRDLFTSEFVHGSDGMGDMHLPTPSLAAAPGHAIDKIIELVTQNPHAIEIITLGPLTNLALAYLKAPRIAQLVKHVFVMGGSGFGPGNITPVAEFNIYVDAEAAHVILNSGMPLTFIGWDVSTDETFINQADIDFLLGTGSPIAQFCVRCNEGLRLHNEEIWGQSGFDLPDPTAVIAALYPEIILKQSTVYSFVEYKSPDTYGQMVIDANHLLKRAPNATLCHKIDAAQFKQILFSRIQ